MLFEVVADLSCVGCRADRLKDEFFAEISATHPAVAELNDAEDRKEVDEPPHGVLGSMQVRRGGSFFAHLDCGFAPPHLGVCLPTPADRYTISWVQREL